MSLSTLIQEARSVLTGYSPLTSVVPANKISFSQRAQGAEFPGIVIDLGNVDYEQTMSEDMTTITYRVDYRSYAKSAQQTSQIHELVKAAISAASSSNFYIRHFDELYFVDVDLIHRSTVSATFEMSTTTSSGSTVNYITQALNARVTANARVVSGDNVDETDWLSDDFILQIMEEDGTVTLPEPGDNKNRIIGVYYGYGSGQCEISVAEQGTIDGNSNMFLNTTTRFAAFIALDQSAVSQSETTAWKTIWKQ